MKTAPTSVVVIALVAALYFTFGQPQPATFIAKPDRSTQRKTTAGNVLHYTGARQRRYGKASAMLDPPPREKCDGEHRCHQRHPAKAALLRP